MRDEDKKALLILAMNLKMETLSPPSDSSHHEVMAFATPGVADAE